MKNSKIYYVTEGQFKELIQKKKGEKIIQKKIYEQISILNESTDKSDRISKIIKENLDVTNISDGLIKGLLEHISIKPQDLIKAGISSERVTRLKPQN